VRGHTFRFIDDIFAVIHGEPAYATQVMDELNMVHENLKFTYDISLNESTFLDVRICKDPTSFRTSRRLETAVHQKALNAYLYVPYSSYHLMPAKRSFITGELKRYIRLSSTFTAFNDTANKFFQRLKDRGYPARLLRRLFATVSYKDRPGLLQPKGHMNDDDTTPEKEQPLLFHARLDAVTKNIRWRNLLELKSEERVIVAYSHPPNLQAMLVRAAMSLDSDNGR
jgi:hypothetical protein